MRANKLDETNLKIIQLLSNDARKAVTQLARDIGVSRPTAHNRLNSLINKKIIQFNVCLDLRKLGFHIWEVGLKVEGTEAKLALRRVLSRCPRILLPTCSLTDANVSLYMFGEDTGTIRSVIESFKEFPNTEVVNISRLEPSAYPDNFKVNLYPDKGSVAPCGRKCRECLSYQNNLCVGCPAVTEYKGPL